MTDRNKSSYNDRASQIIRDLVGFMRSELGDKTTVAVERAATHLHLPNRKTKSLFFQDQTARIVAGDVEQLERNETNAWLRLADHCERLAERCEAKAKARLEQKQGVLPLDIGNRQCVGSSKLQRRTSA